MGEIYSITMYELEKNWCRIIIFPLIVLTIGYGLAVPKFIGYTPISSTRVLAVFGLTRALSMLGLIRFLITIITPAISFGGDIHSGSVKVLLSLPVNRRNVFMVKALLGLLVLYSSFAIPLILVSWLILDASTNILLTVLMFNFIRTLFNWSVAVICSIILARVTLPLLVSGIILLSTDIVGNSQLSPLNESIYYEYVARYVVGSILGVYQQERELLELTSTVLIVIAITLLISSYIIFLKRDFD